jgi:tetratricopeptide (TPR) repeat protein
MSTQPRNESHHSERQDNLDFEINFFEAILADSPEFLDALIPLAEAYTQRGLFEKGLATDLKIAQLRPNDPIVYYNLACSYALLDKGKEAFECLERALTLGFRDWKLIKRDRDLKNLRKDVRLQSLLSRFFEKERRGQTPL